MYSETKDDEMAQLRVQTGAITLEKKQLEKLLLVIKQSVMTSNLIGLL
jgi:hypothetical protein